MSVASAGEFTLGHNSGVTVLVDEARWPWRGERWAHLVSDDNLEELHEFARVLGVRRLAFWGDHYDIRADVRLRAIDLGAEPTEARILVRRLRGAGLRLPPHRRPAKWAITTHDLRGDLDAPMIATLDLPASMTASLLDLDAASVRIFRRPHEVVALVTQLGGGELELWAEVPQSL